MTQKRILICLRTPSSPHIHHLNRIYLHHTFRKLSFRDSNEVAYRVKFEPEPPNILFYSQYYSDILTWFLRENIYHPNILLLLWHVDKDHFEEEFDIRNDMQNEELKFSSLEEGTQTSCTEEVDVSHENNTNEDVQEHHIHKDIVDRGNKDDLQESFDEQGRIGRHNVKMDDVFSLEKFVPQSQKNLSYKNQKLESKDTKISPKNEVYLEQSYTEMKTPVELSFDESQRLWKEVVSTPDLKNIHGKIASGGTFDYMHPGHFLLLTLQAMIYKDTNNSSFIVGITSNSLLKNKKHGHLIAPLNKRIDNVRKILNELRPGMQLNLVELHDPWGPTITDDTIEAIVVSEETLTGSTKINSIRMENNMNPLQVYIVPCIKADGSSEKMSSSTIREYMARKVSLSISKNLD